MTNLFKLGEGAAKKHTRLPKDEPREQHIFLLTELQEGNGSLPSRTTETYQCLRSQEETVEIYGYTRSHFLTLTTWTGIVLTVGFLRLVLHWKQEYLLKFTHRRCKLSEAHKLLFVTRYKNYKQHYVVPVDILGAEQFELFRNPKKGLKNRMRHYAYLALDVNSTSNSVENGMQLSPPRQTANGTLQRNLVIPTIDGPYREVRSIRTCVCKNIRYLWDENSKSWYVVDGFGKNVTIEEMQNQRGLNEVQRQQRQYVYGPNVIDVPVDSILKILYTEALNPFYVFQLFSVCLWYSDEYYYYATAIVIMSAFGLITTIIQTRRNQQALRDTIHSLDFVEVAQANAAFERLESQKLVPGDVIAIPQHGCIMQCDAVLLYGTCIVNESMLTGESVPVTKVSLENENPSLPYSSKEFARSTLFCGTEVIQTRYYESQKVLAVVIKTGFLTSKGNLVRSIMYPLPVDFKFNTDSYKFIGVLALIAAVGFIYTTVSMALAGEEFKDILLNALDLITIVVPPALPMAMTIGILFAANRLSKKDIYCISPRSINISGSLNCVCFDKTGTLTEDGLDMYGIVPVSGGNFGASTTQAEALSKVDTDGAIMRTLAVCHSLTRIKGKLSGHPLDLKMFEWTDWILEEPEGDDTTRYDLIVPTVVRPQEEAAISNEVGIVRQFPFSSSEQRMSVIARQIQSANFDLHVKGSPEIIRSLCDPETVPEDFIETLGQYTRRGFRVIGLAWKRLEGLAYHRVAKIAREDIENNLTFLGLMIMENRLKPVTANIIQELQNARIRTIMITGDNIQTALSVAQECRLVFPEYEVYQCVARLNNETLAVSWRSMVTAENNESVYIDMDVNPEVQRSGRYHLTIDGKSFAILRETNSKTLLEFLAVKGAIFARMSPHNKQQLIEDLKELGYYVGMCGDGANDCGALKAAHAGISLSDTEASVASPFTSKEANISCVPRLIREGRAALVTSFGVFKYMALYSLIQFISVMILYDIGSNLSDFQFLYIDLFLITVFATFFGYTEAYSGPLVKHAPPASLMSVTPIMSIFLQIALVAGTQTFSLYLVRWQPWFMPFNESDPYNVEYDTEYACHENYIIFTVSMFQYIIMAVVYARGAPYRKAFYTNYWFTGSVVVLTAVSLWIAVYPTDDMIRLFELRMPEAMEFRALVLLIPVGNLLLSFLLEHGFVYYIIFRKWRKLFIRRKYKRYKILEEQYKNPDGPTPLECSFSI